MTTAVSSCCRPVLFQSILAFIYLVHKSADRSCFTLLGLISAAQTYEQCTSIYLIIYLQKGSFRLQSTVLNVLDYRANWHSGTKRLHDDRRLIRETQELQQVLS